MEEIRATGGARIGAVNASWPFAKVVASAKFLRLSSLLGTYDFLPSEVVSLERYGSIPFFYSGIRIVHARSEYPAKIIFWYFGNAETLIGKIRETGFMPTAPASSEIKWRGFPVRWTTILLFILIWNGLFLVDGVMHHSFVKWPGFITLIPVLLAFLVCWGTKTSPGLQKIIVSDNHSVDEIKAYLTLIQLVSGILFVVVAVLVLGRAFG
jgi:hypothetical protein